MNEKTPIQRYASVIILLAALGWGIAGVLLFEEHGLFPEKRLEHLSMAFAIAGALGLLIDLALRKEIAKDVFEASIGYLLPDELKGELRWIAETEFICQKHIQTVTIKKIEGTSFVTVHTALVRIFRNVTASTQPFSPGLGVWEKFVDGHPVKIHGYTCQYEGQQRGENLATTVTPSEAKAPVLSTGALPKFPVQSGKCITASSSYTETMMETDLIYSHFGFPTSNVTVIVNCEHPGIGIDVQFSHRKQDPKITNVSDNTWVLDGPLLPLQGIRIYMFRKDKYEAWKASFK